jgi:hypothetical protein
VLTGLQTHHVRWTFDLDERIRADFFAAVSVFISVPKGTAVLFRIAVCTILAYTFTCGDPFKAQDGFVAHDLCLALLAESNPVNAVLCAWLGTLDTTFDTSILKALVARWRSTSRATTTVYRR